MISCPLCCGEEFADAKALTAHLSAAYKRLRCPMCEIHFDNLMVMIKHLERGCSGAVTSSGSDAEKAKNATADSEDLEDDVAAYIDESDNDDVKEQKQDITDNTETISEDQYLDKNGQVYRRRVVKISNLWSELSAPKQGEEDSGEVSTPLKAAGGAGGKGGECPLCGKVLRGEHSLRLHLEVVHRGQAHACCYCSQVFQSELALKEHVAERHSMPYSCVYCNKPFNNLAMAKKHVECHKNTKKPAFQCELCSETAHTNAEIKRHYRQLHLKELQPRDAPTPIAPYKKGSMWYEWRGYTYHQTHTTRSGVQVMRCWVDGCWAEVRVPVIGSVASQGQHTHEPYTWLRERNELYNTLRRRCMTETTPIRIIYDEEALRFPEGAKNLVFPEATMRSWQRTLVRSLDDPTLEITLENQSEEWADMNDTQVMILPHGNEVLEMSSGRKRKRIENGEM